MKKFGLAFLTGLIILMILGISGCGEDMTAQDGDIVQVHYTGTLDDGSTFDTSAGSDPLEFTVGAGKMIQGFDSAVKGMKVGDVKTVTIPADEAYGQPDENLYLEFQRSELPEGMDPAVGDQLPLSTSTGRQMMVPVIAVTETSITVDANHALAGKDLTFKIEMMNITRP